MGQIWEQKRPSSSAVSLFFDGSTYASTSQRQLVVRLRKWTVLFFFLFFRKIPGRKFKNYKMDSERKGEEALQGKPGLMEFETVETAQSAQPKV
jgi:hypothetical protein